MGSTRAAGVAAWVMLGVAIPLQAQAIVRPRVSTLVAGRVRTFEVRAPGVPPDWSWTLTGGVGHLDAATGRFEAPAVTEPHLVTLRAAHRTQTGLWAEALVLVLPHEPFDLVGQMLGPDWLEPFALDLPFRDLATGLRHGAAEEVQPEALPGRVAAGCGVPFTLAWAPQPGAQGLLLSFEAGGEVVRLDVSGQEARELTLWSVPGRCTVEALGPGPEGWRSVIQPFNLRLRGLLPFAGTGEPGHCDGPCRAARFQEPFGVARVVTSAPGAGAQSWHLVSDAGSHVVRLISPEGDVTTPWGVPGSLFHEPTFLCVSEGVPWQCVVADTGNHCLRVLRPGGEVATLAGVPGQPGHRDGSRARFNRPMGLAEDGQGRLYVADQGNRVIRRLAPDGEVVTLAGAPGQAGTADGPGPQARFTELRGLALQGDPMGTQALYAADGHAIRRISLPDGEVTTVLGQVATPGFQDVLGGHRATREEALRAPCLNGPCGLQAVNTGLLIVDQGNHCLRTWHFDRATLETLVGDPGEGHTRWGLLRKGLEVTPDERFGALASPRTVLGNHPFTASMIVTTGAGLGQVLDDATPRDTLGPVTLDCPPAALAQPCAVRFSVAAETPQGEPVVRPIHFAATFLEPDGTLAAQVRGRGSTAEAMTALGPFGQRGTGTVRVICVTDQGSCSGVEGKVDVH